MRYVTSVRHAQPSRISASGAISTRTGAKRSLFVMCALRLVFLMNANMIGSVLRIRYAVMENA